MSKKKYLPAQAIIYKTMKAGKVEVQKATWPSILTALLHFLTAWILNVDLHFSYTLNCILHCI